MTTSLYRLCAHVIKNSNLLINSYGFLRFCRQYPLINYLDHYVGYKIRYEEDDDDSQEEENDCECSDLHPPVCGLTLIHFAAMCNEIDIVVHFIEKDPLNQFEGLYGYNPLYFAAEKGHWEACKLLIEHFKITIPNDKVTGSTLIRAAANGHANVCQLIIDKIKERHSNETAKKMLNSKANESNLTALHYAAIYNKPEVCQLLMKESLIDKLPIDKMNAGEPPNNPGERKLTPLHYAAVRGHFEVIKVMIEHLDIDERNPSAINGVTPLHVTIRNDGYGQPTPSKITPSHLKICQFLIEKNVDKNPKDIDENTPLHYAAEDGHVEICKMILEDVKNKNPGNRHGETPLHLAAEKGHFDICSIIIDQVDEISPKTHRKGQTPLHLAIEYQKLDVCRLLISKSQNLNVPDKKGKTALHYAAKNGQLEMYQSIIAKVKNKSPVDKTGKIPLHLAGQFGHFEVCELILKNASDKKTRDRKDYRGKTPFETVKSARIKKANKAKLLQLFESYKCE